MRNRHRQGRPNRVRLLHQTRSQPRHSHVSSDAPHGFSSRERMHRLTRITTAMILNPLSSHIIPALRIKAQPKTWLPHSEGMERAQPSMREDTIRLREGKTAVTCRRHPMTLQALQQWCHDLGLRLEIRGLWFPCPLVEKQSWPGAALEARPEECQAREATIRLVWAAALVILMVELHPLLSPLLGILIVC